jgi:hypothetical protein
MVILLEEIQFEILVLKCFQSPGYQISGRPVWQIQNVLRAFLINIGRLSIGLRGRGTFYFNYLAPLYIVKLPILHDL